MSLLLIMAALTILVMLVSFVVMTHEDRAILREQEERPYRNLQAGD